MTLKHYYEDLLPIANDAYAWRYMNFEKTWDMLANNQISFVRLDCFNDPIESIDPLTLSHLCTYINPPLKSISHDDNFKKATKMYYANTLKIQKQLFASCWYLTENTNSEEINHHESLAMWQFVMPNNGFTLKVNFSNFLKNIKRSLLLFDDGETIEPISYSKIVYKTLFQRISDNASGIDGVQPFYIKDKSFNHENELRFIMDCLEDSVYKIKKIHLIDNIKDMDIRLFAHPDMDEMNFKVFKEKFETINIQLSKSQLVTKSIVKKYLF